MLTKAQIEAAEGAHAAGRLTETARRQWLTLVRSMPEYRKNRSLYPGLEQKLAEASGLTAQILQAALTEIERVGAGQESLGSDQSSGVSWSREGNRAEFIRDGLGALYDAPAQSPQSAVAHPADSWRYADDPFGGCGRGGKTLL
jgi:hypothetical protein